MGVTAGIFLASILLKEIRYLVYIRYLSELNLWLNPTLAQIVNFAGTNNFEFSILEPCFSVSAFQFSIQHVKLNKISILAEILTANFVIKDVNKLYQIK